MRVIPTAGQRATAALAAAGLVVVLVLVAAVTSHGSFIHLRQLTTYGQSVLNLSPEGTTQRAPSRPGVHPPGQRQDLPTKLLLALVALGAMYWLMRLGRITGPVKLRRIPEPDLDRPQVEPVEALRRELDEALAAVRRRPDSRTAIVECWARLEEAAARAGTPRRPTETPSELLARVLADHAVSRTAMQRLTTLYLEARYSNHDADPAVTAEAVEALALVRRELGAPALDPS